MARRRLFARNLGLWQQIRALLMDVYKQPRPDGTRENWSTIARALGVSKQHLSGFVQGRVAALDAEAVFRLCAKWELGIALEEETTRGMRKIVISPFAPPPTIPNYEDAVRVRLEFDDSFVMQAEPASAAVLTRKPPSRASFIAVRVERVMTP